MEINGKDVYFIAVKALIRDGDKLLITHDIFKSWDIPGGRIKKDEFKKPLEDVLRRKISEELGADIKYDIGPIVTSFRVERDEVGIEGNSRIFAVGYEVNYRGGEITLGPPHDEYRSVDVNDFDPKTLFADGWEVGLGSYLLTLRND
jgi:8-oxo-dGTP pyrophosphatase MutT (NUDIX family)